jgi:hypothetical protein
MGDTKESLSLYATVQIREFLGAAVSAGSGCPITLSWQNPFMKPQRKANRNPWYGERSKKRPLKKLRGHSQTPLPDVMKPFFLYVHEGLGTAIGVLTQLVGSWHHLVIYLSSNLMQFPEAGHPACAPWQPLPSWWLKQTNLLWDKTHSLSSPLCFDMHKI